MVYFRDFARAEIFFENARELGVGCGQFYAGANGLIGVRGDGLSPSLGDCGVLGIASHCEEFATTRVHPFLQLKFRAQTGSLGCFARDTSLIVKKRH